jgi:uroporphyrinogen decarboxylase
MNSRERVLAVLEGRQPDRVPLMELFIDRSVIDSISKGMDYFDFLDFIDMDVVTCLTMADADEDVNWIDKGKGIWEDKWGARQAFTGEVISVPMEPPRIQTIEDFAGYDPPDPEKAPVLKYAEKLCDRFKGKRAVAVVGEAVFAPSQNLRGGLTNLMMDYLLQPEVVKRLAHVAADYHIELYRKLIDMGVEIIILGDDYAGKTGPFMSPTHFGEFILPGLSRVVKEIKNCGAYCIKHTDGNIWSILDMLIGTGLDMLGPLEPAYMRLDEVRKHSGMKVGVVGNVDVDLLARGTEKEIEIETREQIKRISPLGGHFLSSGNSISSAVKAENFLKMVETVKSFGKYPLQVA